MSNRLSRQLFPRRPAPSVWRKHPEPDWTKIHEDLQTHKDVHLTGETVEILHRGVRVASHVRSKRQAKPQP